MVLVSGTDAAAREGDLGARWTQPVDSPKNDARVGQVLQATVWGILDPPVDRSHPLLHRILDPSIDVR